MRDMASTIRQLQAVKEAGQHFLTLWAADCLLLQSKLIDRLAEDIGDRTDPAAASEDPANAVPLYRQRLLDD